MRTGALILLISMGSAAPRPGDWSLQGFSSQAETGDPNQ
jgi:hypothetical protein